MRKRLIELLCAVECKGDDRREGGCSFRQDDQCNRINKLDMCMIEQIADHLLANGVIVPPCKVGDTVWCLDKKDVSECKVSSIEFGGGCENIVVVNLIVGGYVVPMERGYYFSDFGKIVFLTEDEAMRNQKNKLSWSEFKGTLDDGKISAVDLKAMYNAYIDDSATE